MAWYGVRGLLAFAPSQLVNLAVNHIALDGGILVYLFLIACATGLLLGLLPASVVLRSSRHTSSESRGRYADLTRDRGLLRSGLVIVQVAVSVALLLGAGLLTRSFNGMIRSDHGFDADGLLYVEIGLSTDRYLDAPSQADFYQRLERRVDALPGVTASTLASGMPMSGGGFYAGVQLEAEGDDPLAAENQPTILPFEEVRPDYFRVLGIRFTQGRAFESTDLQENRVAVVDGEMARLLWGSGPAVGKRFRIGDDAEWFTVIGVTEDVTMYGPDDRLGRYDFFLPEGPHSVGPYSMLAVRTSGDEGYLETAIQEIVREMDPRQPIYQIESARDAVVGSAESQQFIFLLSLFFALVGLLLASVGLFGLLAYSVDRRMREFGIRMALGAQTGSVVRIVIGHGMRLTLLGLGAGFLAGWYAVGLLGSILYNLSPQDPFTFGIAGSILVLVAFSACLLPALRAARLDPAETLRAE